MYMKWYNSYSKTTWDDDILKAIINWGGDYSREAFIYFKFKKEEVFIRRGFIRERRLIEEIR